MRRNRAQIVGDEMQKVLSRIINNDVKDPRIPLLTSIVEVRMSSDLTHATCYVSVFGDEHAKSEALRAIIHASSFIRREMCKYINLRVAPELHFKLDTTLDDAMRMESLIDKTLADDKKKREELGIKDDEE